MKRINLCPRCICGIRSHGEPLYVGSEIDYDEFYEEHHTEAKCDFCDEESEIYECILEGGR